MKKATKVFLILLSVCLLGVCLAVAAFAEEQAYAVFNEETGVMTFCVGEQDATGVQRTAGGHVDGIVSTQNVLATTTTSLDALEWGWSQNAVTKVAFLDEIKPASTACWFYSFSKLSEITGFENLNTEDVTDMHRMFSNCSKLESIAFGENFKTENVTTMAFMFTSCASLQSLDVSGFNTESVTNMGGMFAGCRALESLDLQNFNTEAVTDMHAMFSSCKNLKKLDLRSFAIKDGVQTSGAGFFSNCSSLSEITLGENFAFRTSMTLPSPESNDTYTGYWVLNDGDGTQYTAADLIDAYDGATMAGTWTWELKVAPYVLFDSTTGTMTFCVGTIMDGGVKRKADGQMIEGTVSSVDVENDIISGDYYRWGWLIDDIRNVVILDEIKPISTAYWFQLAVNLTEIEGLENLNTINTTDMGHMFECCPVLDGLNTINFNTENVTNMANMFDSCYKLTKVQFGENFKTTNVKNMSAMFARCTNLTELDLSSFETPSLENMNTMFRDCRALKELDLHTFNTENVTSIFGLFSRCDKLQSLDISSFDTNAVVPNGYSPIFSGCQSLSEIKLGENFVFIPSEIELPEAPVDDTYTGSWVLLGGDGTRYTAAELTAAYDGATMAGTYGWEEGPRLEDAEVTVADALYTGEEVKPEVTVVVNGKTLVEGEDYTVTYTDNIEPGTATVTITPLGDYYKGEFIATFKITKTLADATVTVETDEADYTGEDITPPVTVTLPDVTVLTEGEDYEITYTDNKDPGDATVTVTGKGIYSGKLIATFKIIRNLSGATVKVADKVQFCKNTPATTKVTVIVGGKVLKKGEDYTVTYVDNNKPGTAKVIIKGIGAYTGQTEGTFEIVEPSESGKIIRQQSIFQRLIQFIKALFAKLASIC